MSDYENYMYTPDCPFCKFFGDVDGRCENCRHKRTYIEEVEKTMYIKRKNALNAFNNAFYSGLAAKIKEIPSEDVTPVRHGRWESFEDVFMDTCYQCSECGLSFYLADGGTPKENENHPELRCKDG